MIELAGKKAVLNLIGIIAVTTIKKDIKEYGKTQICPYWNWYFYYVGKRINDCNICQHFFPKIGKGCPCHCGKYTKEDIISFLNELLQQSSESLDCSNNSI